ncbi:unnamed protein product [Alternaria alternata]
MNANLHATSKSSRPPQTSTPDHEGIDISLLLNVIQVADLLETALDHEDTGDQSSAAADIRLSRQTLQDVLRSQIPWLGETMSFGDFTLIIVQVCSPGPITDVVLIIALSGLYWMFNILYIVFKKAKSTLAGRSSTKPLCSAKRWACIKTVRRLDLLLKNGIGAFVSSGQLIASSDPQHSGSGVLRRYARWDEDSRGTIGELMPVEFAQHATRATDYLLLVAIYRVAFSKPSTKVSSECIAAARISLREHTQCIALLVSYNNDPAPFELWVNGGLILFPFVPFNIIFCSVIETANLADLESLKTYVDALASLAKKPEYTSCTKQLEIFRALHKLALVHSEIRAQMQLSSCPSGPLSSSAKDAELEGLPNTLGGLPSWHDRDGMWNGSINITSEPSILASQPWADFGGMDLDPLGTQLGYWIQESSQDFDNFGET